MNDVDSRVGRLDIPRTRGAASGFLLILLGLWGALIPFIGPYFDFAYDPDTPWAWTSGRGWLEVLPGVLTVLGGLLLLASGNRATAMLGGWISVVAGAWFVVGRLFAGPWGLGDFPAPAAGTLAGQVALELTFFSGLGALIIFLGAAALGRLSVRSLRDVRYAQRSVPTPMATSVPVATEPVAAEPVAHEPEPERNWRDRLTRSRRTPVAH
ncbi:hypothetical protein MANY_09070 [Mycolicibacterium anyangense]|uniref:Secreted protein n=1 Tax=Mycolicibacterium anyangense TaxID=1431246 RepID=A0A6N4W110_9MYCO|nr:hypothetical protein [Mycolicibacterium anyangense]BBZ75570.1 hypothetical protein MANY_09070 [Mycolicibacterium anyangense]